MITEKQPESHTKSLPPLRADHSPEQMPVLEMPDIRQQHRLHAPQNLLHLQRMLGNQKTISLLQRRSSGSSNAATRRMIASPMMQNTPTVQRLSPEDVRALNTPDRKKYDDAMKKAALHNLNSNRVNTILLKARSAGGFARAIDQAIEEDQKKALEMAAAKERPLPTTSTANFVSYEKETPDVEEKKPAAKPKAEKTLAAPDPRASSFITFASYQPQTQQNIPETTPRKNINPTHENIKVLRDTHPGQVTRFVQSNMTKETISFNVTVEVPSSKSINVYRFVIHYHPAGGVNSLHAKTTHAATSNVELSAQNWLVTGDASASQFQASCEEWQQQYAAS